MLYFILNFSTIRNIFSFSFIHEQYIHIQIVLENSILVFKEAQALYVADKVISGAHYK